VKCEVDNTKNGGLKTHNVDKLG